MQRGNVNTVLLIIILLILGFAAIGGYYIYRNITSIKLLPWLTTEIGNKPILTLATLSTIEPGQVYQITGDMEGWQVKIKDVQLYEYLILQGVDIKPNDVITIHLYDWYFNGNSRLRTPDILSNTNKWTVVTAADGTSFVFRASNLYVSIDNNKIGIYNFNWTNRGYHYPSSTTTHKIFSAVWDGADLKLYLDGYLDTTISPGGYGYISSVSGINAMIGDDAAGGIAFTGVISAVIFYSFNYEGISNIIPSSNGVIFYDATFFNGTAYINIFSGADVLTNYGAIRIPAEKIWLWYIESLFTDNMLHFKYFPKGTIIQIKDSNGNIIRKFTIDGISINLDDQIEDYTINLNTDLIAQGTIEAWVPSQKVRVYGPYGATIQILDANGIVVGEAKVSANGYVDIPLTETVANGQIIVQADDIYSGSFDIQADLNNNVLDVKIFENNIPIPGLLVRVADPSGVVIASGITDQSGSFEAEIDHPLPSATIEVSGIWNYKLVYQSQEFTFSSEASTTTSTSSEQIKLLLLGAFVIVLIAAIIVFTTRGIRVRS